jgi:hypothetical protein
MGAAPKVGNPLSAETIAFGYDGSLRADLTYSGTVAGTLHWDYNSHFRVSQEKVNNGLAASFAYDRDGLMTNAGDMTPTLEPQREFRVDNAILRERHSARRLGTH